MPDTGAQAPVGDTQQSVVGDVQVLETALLGQLEQITRLTSLSRANITLQNIAAV